MGDYLIKFAADYGFVAIILIAVGFILFLYGKHRLLPKFTKLSDAKLNNDTKLSYHSIFANINHRLNNEIPTLDLMPSKPVKQQLFRDILSIYSQTLFETCKNIAEIDMTDWGSDKWCDEINKKLNENNYAFVKNCRAVGIPEIVLTKFLRWHRPTQDILFDGIMSLGNSNIFTSNVSRTNTLFFMLNLLLVTTIADAEKTLKSLNGDVHGTLYNGREIED